MPDGFRLIAFDVLELSPNELGAMAVFGSVHNSSAAETQACWNAPSVGAKILRLINETS